MWSNLLELLVYWRKTMQESPAATDASWLAIKQLYLDHPLGRLQFLTDLLVQVFSKSSLAGAKAVQGCFILEDALLSL